MNIRTSHHGLEPIATPNNQCCTFPSQGNDGRCLDRATHVHKFTELIGGDWKPNSMLLCAEHAMLVSRICGVPGYAAADDRDLERRNKSMTDEERESAIDEIELWLILEVGSVKEALRKSIAKEGYTEDSIHYQAEDVRRFQAILERLGHCQELVEELRTKQNPRPLE